MTTVRIHGRTVTFTQHATERFLERVLNGNGDEQTAATHMRRLAQACGRFEADPPEWAVVVERGASYLYLGDDIVLPLLGNMATTCLTRGGLPDEMRRLRNEARSRRTRKARFKGPEGGRPRVPEERWAA